MTYLPENIFKNILAYCDDRIEREQKNINKLIVRDITVLKALSNTIIQLSNDSDMNQIAYDMNIHTINRVMINYFVSEPDDMDDINIYNKGFDNLFLDYSEEDFDA
jgi:hypothetical protein